MKKGDRVGCVRVFSSDKKLLCESDLISTENAPMSFTEKEKGLASDSFKRACFNWGIGRELYTAPFIWITSDKANITKNKQGKFTCYDRFYVEAIQIKNKVITGLAIKNSRTNTRVFVYKKED